MTKDAVPAAVVNEAVSTEGEEVVAAAADRTDTDTIGAAAVSIRDTDEGASKTDTTTEADTTGVRKFLINFMEHKIIFFLF